MRVSVIGGGAWGTTLASLAAARADTLLWALEPEVVEAVEKSHENPIFLSGATLPEALHATGDLERALTEADVVVVAVPSAYMRSVMQRARDVLPPDITVVSVTKGIEGGSCKRMTEVLADVLPGHEPGGIGVLAGPNLAREVIAGHPSATCVAFLDPERARAVQALFMGDILRVYTHHDVIGCEIGGSVKNVIAIAAGVADGLGYGMNTKAALITRGLAELTRLGLALGGEPLTFLGLAGNGDLVATCTSPLSRNRHVGEELGKGRALDDIISQTHSVAEGVKTVPSVLQLAERHGVDMPIAAAVGALVRGECKPAELVPQLMRRQARSELDGIT